MKPTICLLSIASSAKLHCPVQTSNSLVGGATHVGKRTEKAAPFVLAEKYVQSPSLPNNAVSLGGSRQVIVDYDGTNLRAR
mgnify:CR=1 FL=1